ncbi:MAG TPA: ATP-binding protein [bacterium]|nr:ATP-binding protein [bacterium]
MVRTRILLMGFCPLAALAIADVATGWRLMGGYALPILVAAGVAAVVAATRVAERRTLWLVLMGLVTLSAAVHLAYSVSKAYEARHWTAISSRKADAALARAVSAFEDYVADASRSATEISQRKDIRHMLEAGDRAGVFARLADAARSPRSLGRAQGIAVRSPDGSAVAWAGSLPSYFGAPASWQPSASTDLTASIAYYWIEANARLEVSKPSGSSGPGSDAASYWVTVFRAIDARYPGVLPGGLVPSLREGLSRRVGQPVTLDLGAGPRRAFAPAATDSGRVAELTLPDGRVVGRVGVELRSADDEETELTNQGLLVAGLLVLALILVGAVVLGRLLAGSRFSKASIARLALILAVVWLCRLGLVVLRDALRLGELRAFTPYDYATQVPTGILRSPADLALTGVAAALSLAIVVLARRRSWREPHRAQGGWGSDGALHLAFGLLAGGLGLAAVVASDFILSRVLRDMSINPFTGSPFDLHASAFSLRIGLFGLSAACLALVGSLVAWQIRSFGRLLGRATSVLLAAAMTLVLVGAVAFARRDLAILMPAGLGFVAGLAFYGISIRKLVPNLVTVVVAFTLGAALLQFPYASRDFYAKEREAIQLTAAQLTARTDEWKRSMLEEALGQLAADSGVREALASPGPSEGRLDSEALRLWAGSILSHAQVACGVHILDAANHEIGRFSLEDIGDLTEIESSIRSARFASGPTSFVTRGTFGGKDTDLYVGVAPLSAGGSYLGSVVISIPYFYNDLEWMAGLRPTFFEQIGSPPSGEVMLGEGYSASLVSDGRVRATTARDIAVGSRIPGLDSQAAGWVERRVAGAYHAFYPVPFGSAGETLVFSYKALSASEWAVYLMSVILANSVIALAIVILAGAVKGTRHLAKRARGFPQARFRWSFATKLALAFLVMAIVPALILGVASREFLRARLREVMESKAQESLNLSKLALQRQVQGEAARLARNPILMDELRVEPSILGVLVSNDVSAAVADSSGRMLATFGEVTVPPYLISSVTREGRSYDSFSATGGLTAKSAVPIRDAVYPDRIAGCAFVSRPIDEPLALRLASELNRDVTFYAGDRVLASSRQELFVAEMMPMSMAPQAYVACFLGGRELAFTWQRVGNADLVIGYSPVRDFDGHTTGAISVPLVFRKDAVGQRMEWTSTAISYLVAMVIASIFVLGLVLARRMARPIRELTDGTLRVSSGDLGFTIPKASDDEIGDLVSSFNRMTAALEKSRNALTERKRYIEAIIGNVGAGIIFTDWRGRIDTLNAAAEHLLGVKAKNVRNREARDVLRKIGAGGLALVLDEVSSASGMARREVTFSLKDGTTATLRAVATRVAGPRERMMGKVIVFEDVTELIRSKKLIAWSEMARQVAHEIKNPLTPMKLSAQQLLQARRDGASDFDKILEESVATIVDQIESLRRIAVEFSQFSRMPERRLEAVGVNEIVEDSLGQYERTVAGMVEIRKSLDPANPKLRVDRDEIKRVFLNVIENAIQAMPDGGRLEVRSGTVKRQGGAPGASNRADDRRGYGVSASSRGSYMAKLASYVEVSFTDTGVGISAANSEKLFEPNFSTKTQGTGLGLAISKGIMDAYGGEIFIESTENVGTSVRVRFPTEEKPTGQRPPRRTGNRRRYRPRRG